MQNQYASDGIILLHAAVCRAAPNQNKQAPKRLSRAPQLLDLCRGHSSVPSATPPVCQGTCQPLEASSHHCMLCTCACLASPGQRYVSGARQAVNAQVGAWHKVAIVPHALPQPLEFSAFLSPKLVSGSQLPSFILTWKKNNSSNTSWRARESAQA